MDYWGRTQEALLTSIRLLGDSGMEAEYGGRGHDTVWARGARGAHRAANFGVGIVGVGVVQFALGWGLLHEAHFQEEFLGYK